MNDSLFAKFAITVVILIALAVWRTQDRIDPAGCQTNCPTDISANRK
jgi:hypothetical protein